MANAMLLTRRIVDFFMKSPSLCERGVLSRVMASRSYGHPYFFGPRFPDFSAPLPVSFTASRAVLRIIFTSSMLGRNS